MKRAYCWRCKDFVVCIEEADWDDFGKLYRESIESAQEYRKSNGCSLDKVPLKELFAPVYRFYEGLGGDTTVGHEEIYNHGERRFGSSCPGCGKNFRTPEAEFCAECGYRSGADFESRSI